MRHHRIPGRAVAHAAASPAPATRDRRPMSEVPAPGRTPPRSPPPTGSARPPPLTSDRKARECPSHPPARVVPPPPCCWPVLLPCCSPAVRPGTARTALRRTAVSFTTARSMWWRRVPGPASSTGRACHSMKALPAGGRSRPGPPSGRTRTGRSPRRLRGDHRRRSRHRPSSRRPRVHADPPRRRRPDPRPCARPVGGLGLPAGCTTRTETDHVLIR